MEYFGVEVTYYDLGSFDESTDIESIEAYNLGRKEWDPRPAIRHKEPLRKDLGP